MSRASWIHETQSSAGPQYDFAVRGEGLETSGAVTIEDVAFVVDGERLTLSRGAWSSELELSRFGRGAQMHAVTAAAPRVEGNEWVVDHERVSERWISGPLGVEQILSLSERPAGSGDLVVDLVVSGDLVAHEDGAGNIELRDASGAVRARYSDVYVEDAAHRAIPATLELASAGIRIRVQDEDATYPLVIDPLVGVEQAHLVADNAAENAFFGQAVAFDGTTAVIGAIGGDGVAAGDATGAVYVFTRTGTTWSAPVRLHATGGASFDSFGSSVGISGDTIVVGAPFATPAAASGAGAAYVFVRSGTTWTQQQRLVASDAAVDDGFGNSVAIDGSTIVVGASADGTPGGAGAGSAYVFTRAGTVWTEATHLSASDGAAGDAFGTSVGISGGTVAVGAPTDDVGATADTGSAYVFTGAGTTWTQQQHIVTSDGAGNDNFGVSIAVLSNLLVVGASLRNGGQGSVVTFTRAGTTWTQGQRLTTATAPLSVGGSVATDGTTIVAGTTNSVIAGYAVIFGLSGGTWSETGRVVAADGMVGDGFGSAVGVSADTVVVGASQDHTAGGDFAGSAYVEILRHANGDSCSAGSTCASGICVDGVCCDTACGGGVVDCQACTVALGGAVDGTCGTFAAGTTCRASAGLCDVAETCNGGTACPADVLVAAGMSCRVAAGDCDVADTCTGTSATCTDTRVAAGTVCRAAGTNATCNPAETCGAASPSCPADTNTDGNSCADTMACNGAEMCMSGACVAGTAPTCMDTDACTADACAEPAGCTHMHIAGCCNVAADCDDLDACTADSCSGAGGTCSHADIPGCVPHDAGLPDAGHDAGPTGPDGSIRDAGPDSGRDTGPRPDANTDANVDAGPSTPPSTNCGCSTVGTSTNSALAPLGLLGLVLVAARRRRR